MTDHAKAALDYAGDDPHTRAIVHAILALRPQAQEWDFNESTFLREPMPMDRLPDGTGSPRTAQEAGRGYLDGAASAEPLKRQDLTPHILTMDEVVQRAIAQHPIDRHLTHRVTVNELGDAMRCVDCGLALPEEGQ